MSPSRRSTISQLNGISFELPISPPLSQPTAPQPRICYYGEVSDPGILPVPVGSTECPCHLSSTCRVKWMSLSPPSIYLPWQDPLCNGDFCYCTYVMEVALGETVEMIIIDEGTRSNGNHPFHLHGYNFHVLGIDRLDTSVPQGYDYLFHQSLSLSSNRTTHKTTWRSITLEYTSKTSFSLVN